jgi:thiosulfate dehydrogenase [quinone] large subunit
LTTAAAFFALVMNYSFFFEGTVSSNPTALFLGATILFAGYYAGYNVWTDGNPLYQKILFKEEYTVQQARQKKISILKRKRCPIGKH